VPGKELIYWLLACFVPLILAGFGFPFPEEVIVTSAGVATARETEFGVYRWLMLPTCITGAFLADVVLYGIGRRYGSRLLERRWMARLVPPKKRERVRDNFHHYGVSILVFGRLVPGIRTTLFLTAGMMRLPLTRFCLADGLGALLGNTIFFFLGYWLGNQFVELIENIEKQVNVARPLIILLILAGVAAYALYLFVRRPIPTGDPEELPLIGHQVAVHLPVKPGPQEAADARPAAGTPEENGPRA
jgi:membrane protein DedA with SNARE-associated domain